MKKTIFLPILFPAITLFFPINIHAQVVVNEYSCTNWKQFLDNYGKYEDWVELYNPANAAVDLGGYYLSDNPDKPKKWKFPPNSIIQAKGYLLVYTSGRDEVDGTNIHTNFKLTQTKNTPEHVVFSNPSGLVINDLEIVKTKTHQSVGRLTDGSNDWRIFTEPTPESKNDGAESYFGFAIRPIADQTAGFYQGFVTVTLTITEPNAVIRYTTDGTEPDEQSLIYSDSLTFAQTTVLKAVTFSDNPDILPSFVQYNTYFVDVSHTLTVVSIGADGVTELANGNASLRPVGSFEYFDKNGQRQARAYGELNEHGQDSWANDQRSMDWITRDEFGYNSAIEEKMFSTTDRDEFQRFILRAAGDDNYPAANHPQNAGSAHIRDAYIHDLADRGGLQVDVRRSAKCIIYLNGEYWGVYDLRERPDEHDFTEYYYGQDKYNLQFIKTWGSTWAEYGDDQAFVDWGNLYDFIVNNDMANPINFKYVDEKYDYKSLVDYVIVNSFTVCSDWLNWNTGWWRGLDPEGGHQKWGYILWDNDATFDHYINYTGIPNTSPYAEPCNPEGLSGWQDPEGHIIILNKLRENLSFDQYYITRQADLLSTVFGCENMLSYLDTIVNRIQPEMQQHAGRWYGNYNQWLQNVDKLRDFIGIRCEAITDGLISCYNLDGPHSTVLFVDPPGAGIIQANSLTHTQFPVHAEYFGGVDLKLIATENPSTKYVFDHWSAQHHAFPDSSISVTALNMTTSDTIIAHFKLTTAIKEPGTAARPSVAAWPSIFKEEVTLNYFLPEKTQVSVTLHSVLGNLALPFDAPQNEGQHTLKLDLKKQKLPAGMYLLRFSTGDFEKTIKLIKAE